MWFGLVGSTAMAPIERSFAAATLPGSSRQFLPKVVDLNRPTPASESLYGGTGEANGSGDSEAGVGLFKSTNFGRDWRLVAGRVAAAKDLSTGAIAGRP